MSGTALPIGWQLAGSSSADATASTLNGSSQGRSYVFISGSDKAIGILNSSSYTSGKTVVFSFTNNTGSTITQFTIAFNYEKYRSGSRAWTWSVAGSSGSLSALNQSYAADADNNVATFSPPGQIAKSATITGLSIANGNNYTITWTLTGSGGSSNGQALGIDDFTLTLPSISISATPSSISGLDYLFGSGPSAPQSFIITGTGTTNPLSVTAPPNFEVATASGGTYSSSLSINSGTTIWVRLKTGLTPNLYSDNITLGGGGAPDKVVPVSGTVSSTGCTPSIANTCDEYIKNVTLNTINKASGCGSTSGYSNFTSTSATILKGQTYSLNITVGRTADPNAGYSTDDIRAWADWDQDGVFDASERIVYVNNNGGAGAYNFTVPSGVPTGNTTLRVRLVRDNETDPCGSSTYGETEDYTLVVNNACTPVATVSNFYPKSGPAGTLVKIVGTGLTGAAVKFNGTDAASVTVISPTEINAEAPAGAGTGFITVTDVNGCDNTTTGKFTFLTESGSCTGAGSYTDLMITEISDPASGNNHYIEIYNGTSNIIDLDVPNNYTLQVFNDPFTTVSADITGVINPGEVKVYYGGNNGGLATGAQSGPLSGFNENDEIRLLKNGSVIDRAQTPNYAGYNYKRLSSVTSPSATYNAAEWTITAEPTTQSTSNLGSYTPATSFTMTGPSDDASSCAINMSVTASPSAGLSYKWKYQNGGTGTTWTDLIDGSSLPGVTVAGATSNSLTITGDLTSYNGYQFYAEVSNGSCIKSSLAAQFTLGVYRNFKSKSPVTGNWTSPSSWLMSTSPSGPWVATCTYPTAANSDTIIIQAGDVITLDASLTLDQVLINTGGYLKTLPTTALSINNGSIGSDLNVLGTFEDGASSGNSVEFGSGATWILGVSGNFIKTNASGSNVWQTNYETGIANIPATATWILRYTGASTNISFTSINAYYPNLIFESTSGNWNPAALTKFTGSSGITIIKGNLDIGGTGTGTVSTLINDNTNATPVQIGGNFIIRAGNKLTNAGSSIYGTGFEVKGNVTVDGTLTLNAGSTGYLKFSGNAMQTISGTGSVSLDNLTIENTGDGVNILRDFTVDDTLLLTQGLLNPKIYTLSLGNKIRLGSGKIDGDSATVNMTGTAAQTIPANTFQLNNLRNLKISNTETTAGVTLAGAVDLYGTLSFGNGSDKILASNGYLNLRSTSAGTAMVADVTNGNASNTNNQIKGNVIVERYFPNRRAWRLLTAPVTNTSSIYKAWQNGGNFIANSGTYVTKPFGTGTSSDGLEESVNYSMKTFNVTTGKLDPITDTRLLNLSDNASGNTAANRGYFTFVRGDRTSTNLIPPNSNLTTLKDTGLLQTYTKTFTASFPNLSINKFMLIGNPYASPVDFDKISKSNIISRKFWAWDPTLNSTLGAYVIVDGQAGNYIINPAPDPMMGATGQDSIIQSSQAIFVQVSATGSASVTFNENDKSIKDNNTVFRPVASLNANDIYESLRANLYLNNADTSILADGVYIQFNKEFSSDVDSYDALKFINILENLGIVVGTQTLSLERRPLVTENDTLFFKLWNTTARNYQFRFSSNGMNHSGLEGFLEDSYTKSSTPIDLNGYTNINFSITADAASKATDRFRIVFKPLAAGPLPVIFTSVKAYHQEDNNINVEWNVSNEVNIKEYEVERSVDGVHFIKISATAAKANNNNSIDYQWLDVNVEKGAYYYRIRSVGNSGDEKYSNIVKVTIGSGAPSIVIYPNPIVNGNINVHFSNLPGGTYRFRILDIKGQIIYSKQIVRQKEDNLASLRLGKRLAHGNYQLELITPDFNLYRFKILY